MNRRDAILAGISTFAAAITFGIIMTPRSDDNPNPGLVQLAYANSLFCIAIIGSTFITIACGLFRNAPDIAEPNFRELRNEPARVHLLAFAQFVFYWVLAWLPKLISMMAVASTMVVFVAFYLLMDATLLYLDFKGPFIFGSVIYLGTGALTLLLWVVSFAMKFFDFPEPVKEGNKAANGPPPVPEPSAATDAGVKV